MDSHCTIHSSDVSSHHGGPVDHCISAIDQVKQENQKLTDTVDHRIHEISHLITTDKGVATIPVVVESEMTAEEKKALIHQKKVAKKAATQTMLIEHAMANNSSDSGNNSSGSGGNTTLPNSVNNNNNNNNHTATTTTLGSLLADSVDIPLSVKQFITKMFGDMLNKVVQVFKPSSPSLPIYTPIDNNKTEEKSANLVEEIKVEVCTSKKEITFWGKSKETSQKIISLFFPTVSDEDRMTGFNKFKEMNEALPYYNP